MTDADRILAALDADAEAAPDVIRRLLDFDYSAEDGPVSLEMPALLKWLRRRSIMAAKIRRAIAEREREGRA